MKRARSCGLVALAMVMLKGLCILAADPVCPREIDHWPYGPCQAAEVSGIYAYVGNGSVLSIVNVSDPANKQIEGEVALPGPVLDMVLDLPLIYVAAGLGGFQVVHTGSVNQPYIFSSLEIWPGEETYVNDLAHSGNYCYVHAGGSMVVVDVTNPALPVRRGCAATYSGMSGGLAMRGNYVVSAGANFEIIDVLDPDEPVIVGALDDGGYDVAVEGDYAFVPHHSSFSVIDVYNPLNPSLIASIWVNWAEGVAVADGVAYLASREKGIQVVDISTPGIPELWSTRDTPGDSVAVCASGGRLYAPDTSSLLIYDTTGGLTLQDLGACETRSRPGDMEVFNGRLYLADGYYGLRILDLGQTGHPVEIGAVETPGTAEGLDVFQGPDFATYVAVADGDEHLQIIDATDPSDPVIVGDGWALNHAYSVAVDWPYAYLGTYGIQIYDITDPASPLRRGSESGPGLSFDVQLHGSTLYAAIGTEGIAAYRVNDVADPYLIGTQGLNNPKRLRVWENILYVPDGDGVHVFNAGAPADLTELAVFCDTSGHSWLTTRDVFVYANTALVTDSDNNLFLYDITVPSAPEEIGSVRGLHDARYVTGALDWAILSDTYGGIQVFDWTWPCDAGLAGDCDGNGSVSIGEVQGAINMFLGSPPDCGVDADGNGTVSIGEVQTVINNFLNP